jgi:hypothetical protein
MYVGTSLRKDLPPQKPSRTAGRRSTWLKFLLFRLKNQEYPDVIIRLPEQAPISDPAARC